MKSRLAVALLAISTAAAYVPAHPPLTPTRGRHATSRSAAPKLQVTLSPLTQSVVPIAAVALDMLGAEAQRTWPARKAHLRGVNLDHLLRHPRPRLLSPGEATQSAAAAMGGLTTSFAGFSMEKSKLALRCGRRRGEESFSSARRADAGRAWPPSTK